MGKHSLKLTNEQRENMLKLKAITSIRKTMKPCACRKARGLTWGWCTSGGFAPGCDPYGI